MDGLQSAELIAAARTLATDAACAAVVAAWQAEGIESILLKGLTTAEWLYPDQVRGYADSDLLVDPARVDDATAVLARLGFAAADHNLSEHSHPWLRAGDGAEVDLHVTLWGSHLAPSQVWETLQGCLQVRYIGPVPVQTLTRPARALLVVLHAAQHAEDGKPHPRVDLRRALERTPEQIWSEVDELAYRLMALTETADGLLLDPEGERLLDRLPLVRAAAFGRREHAPLAIGFQRLAGTPGFRGRLGVILRAIVRPRDEYGLEFATGPEGRRPPLMAYVRGPVWLLAGLARTIVAFRRARRRAPSNR
jgi:hypothetical protein